MAVDTTPRPVLNVEDYHAEEPKWGPIGREVFTRTYARPDSEGRVESWLQTVTRVVNGNVALVDPQFIEPGEPEKLRDLFYHFKAIPAGRHLWVSGVPGRQFLFNCHRAGWTDRISRHYEFTFNELMKGGGVGANYSNNYIEHYPAVRNRVVVNCYIAPEYQQEDLDVLAARGLIVRDSNGAVYPPPYSGNSLMRVPDSREGWYTALNAVIEAAFDPKVNGAHVAYLDFDLNMLRPMGTIIKGFGGIASGPWALATLLRNMAAFLSSKEGVKLTSLDHMQMDHLIAECVVAGNVRRSARWAGKHWKDPDIMDFIHCKKDTSKHWSTNISVETDNEFWALLNDRSRPNITVTSEKHRRAYDVFNAVVEGAARDGEPGFVNTDLASVGERGDVRSPNPCGEIFLEEWENCNLGHVNLGEFADDFEGACEAFRLMERYLLRATFGDITDPAQRDVVNRNRRTGVGIFGFQEWLVKQGIKYSESWKNQDVKDKLAYFKAVVMLSAAEYSKQLGCNTPIKNTTAAPTGTISQGPGTTPSIQTLMFRWYIRRVRYGADDPRLQGLFARGLKIEDDMYAQNTKVVEFPCKDILVAKVENLGLPAELVEESNEVSVEDYMAVQAMVQECYVDNAISLTINFDPESRTEQQIKNALLKYGPRLKGTTLMPNGSRPQAPYERMTKEEYEATGVGGVSQAEIECSTGACPIK